ncbi:putative carboxypeptidase [Legionella antarctica]|uniref:Putative carboxypeptidase n=1 Tax=Legionella antarctica TaxID=2708020 RepID=A0A6F8T2Y4_9GAMM|nr:LD-carboxypeptidase [Legionella antarctica]BCA94758.1 putative carboxypeptidase [Legionella antarctica]
MKIKKIPVLKYGDTVEVIAPASRCSDKQLIEMRELLESWQLNCIVKKDIFGPDLLCANTDEARLKHLSQALQNPESKAIFCARGGYGSMRLIPGLIRIDQPQSPKILVGMSDITALQLYVQQQWGWPIIHGAAAPDRFSPESIASLKSILFGATRYIEFSGLIPLNQYALINTTIESSVTGGNLSIIQAGVGTSWTLNGRDKIILLEDIGERGYRIDRMLEHLFQANMFQNAAAIVLGDFLEGKEPDTSSLIHPVLSRFAEHCDIPVVQIKGIGHGCNNMPLPFGTDATLQLGNEIKLTCFT